MVIKERDNNVGVGVGVGVGVLACARKDFEMQLRKYGGLMIVLVAVSG